MQPTLSVIIPTHKQKFLRETLQSLIHVQGFSDKIEVIVVENPELTDSTINIVNEFSQKGHNIRLICSGIGANRARNAGILNAKSKYIALLDDDCYAHSLWLSSIISIFTLYPKIGVFGGIVRPVFLGRKPRWLNGFFEQLLACCDYGDEILDWSDWPKEAGAGLVSANLAFRKEIWEELNGFDEEVGYVGRNLTPGDEVNFILDANKIGEPGRLYVGKMMVYHQIDEERCSLEWLKKRAYGQGMGMAKTFDRDKGNIDKTVEDLLSENIIPEWNNYFNIESVSEVRTKLSHEESMRLYLRYLIECRSSYFSGITDYFNNFSSRKTYKDMLKTNPLFTLKVKS